MNEIHSPTQLPFFELCRNGHQVRVFDPRPDPYALGARYVQGGYIADWSVNGHFLTNQPHPAWSAYEGCGLPEVFEWGLGWGDARAGDEFLRIGAGRMEKRDSLNESGGPLTCGVEWEVERIDSSSLRMGCKDHLLCGNFEYAYRLVREVRIEDSALYSVTTLEVTCPWNTPVSWFPHPFVRHNHVADTRIAISTPVHRLDGDEVRFEDSHWSFPPGPDARLVRLAPDTCTSLHVEYRGPERTLGMETDYPVDHVVLFASPQAMSAEPQLVRSWPTGMTHTWSVKYTL